MRFQRSVRVKKPLAVQGNWTYIKEFLGWAIDTEAGIISLLKHNIQKLLTHVDTLTTQHRMGRKELERFMGNIRSMHLAVAGTVAHIYQIQRALT